MPSHALDGISVFDQIVQRAVFQQPFAGRLGADLGNTGHVIHGVAHQGLKIDHQRGRHAKLGRDTGHIAAFAVHGVDNHDVFIHQLGQILVAAGDHHIHALGRGSLGQRADHIVGFHSLDGQHRPAQQAHHFMDGRYLGTQIIGHGRTLSLVLGVQLIAKGGAAGVEYASHVIAFNVLLQCLQHVDHAAYGARGRAFGVSGLGTQVGHRVVGAVQVTGAVNQHQSLGIAHTKIVHAPLQSPYARCPTFYSSESGYRIRSGPNPFHSPCCCLCSSCCTGVTGQLGGAGKAQSAY